MSDPVGTSLVFPTSADGGTQSIPVTSMDPFTQESFLSLFDGHARAGKRLLIARVQSICTTSHNPTYSYYSAHQLNKILFRKFGPHDEYLFRLVANNPLTNTEIVGNVDYFVVEKGEGMKLVEAGADPSAPASPTSPTAKSHGLSLPSLSPSRKPSSRRPSSPTDRQSTMSALMRKAIGDSKDRIRVAEMSVTLSSATVNSVMKPVDSSTAKATTPSSAHNSTGSLHLPMSSNQAASFLMASKVSVKRESGAGTVGEPPPDVGVHILQVSAEDLVILGASEFKSVSGSGRPTSKSLDRKEGKETLNARLRKQFRSRKEKGNKSSAEGIQSLEGSDLSVAKDSGEEIEFDAPELDVSTDSAGNAGIHAKDKSHTTTKNIQSSIITIHPPKPQVSFTTEQTHTLKLTFLPKSLSPPTPNLPTTPVPF
ncbi:hypothetical protein HK097_005392, partial [Rhizophlyctis rosea]